MFADGLRVKYVVVESWLRSRGIELLPSNEILEVEAVTLKKYLQSE